MDECTDLFIRARKRLDVANDIIEILNESFMDTFGQQDPPWNIVKLRNSCAHPGNEAALRKKELFTQLKVIIGEPPRKLIETLVVHLRG